MQHRPLALAALSSLALPLAAGAGDDRIGWVATLSTISHDVSGTVTIADEDTLLVEDFTYDGGGIVVYFYLGTENTKQAFADGLQIGMDLVGTAYSGESLTIDLPAGQTLEGWNAVSVWCVVAGVNFGSGEFAPPPCPADCNDDGSVNIFDFLCFQGLVTTGDPAADCNGDGSVNIFDFLCFQGHVTAGCP
jgi:hypothetical protein